MAGEERRGLVRELPVRAAVAGRSDAEDLVERVKTPEQPPLLLLDACAVGALVEIPVVGDLVAGVAKNVARIPVRSRARRRRAIPARAP